MAVRVLLIGNLIEHRFELLRIGVAHDVDDILGKRNFDGACRLIGDRSERQELIAAAVHPVDVLHVAVNVYVGVCRSVDGEFVARVENRKGTAPHDGGGRSGGVGDLLPRTVRFQVKQAVRLHQIDLERPQDGLDVIDANGVAIVAGALVVDGNTIRRFSLPVFELRLIWVDICSRAAKARAGCEAVPVPISLCLMLSQVLPVGGINAGDFSHEPRCVAAVAAAVLPVYLEAGGPVVAAVPVPPGNCHSTFPIGAIDPLSR